MARGAIYHACWYYLIDSSLKKSSLTRTMTPIPIKINAPTTTPIVYTESKDSGVLLTIRYLCKPHERRTTTEVVWEKVLQVFEPHQDIQLAYQTTRFFDARQE